MSDYKNYFVGSGFPKELTQEDIETSYNAPSFFEEYEDKDTPETKVGQTLQEVFRGAKGSVAGVRKFSDTFNLFLGNVLMASGKESVGGQLVKTSRENLKRIQRDIDLNVIGMNDERRASFATALGSAIPDFAAQIGLALTAGSPVALTAMTAKEFTGELAERTTKANDYNAEKARENLVSSGLYAAGSAVLEKRLGLEPLVNKIFKGKRPLKAAIKGFFSEGGTEFLQGTLSTALQLKDGYVDWNEIPDEIKQNVVEGAIGGILGGTSSFGFALKNRAVLARKLKERYGVAWGKNADKTSMNVANALLSEASAEVVNELAVTSEMQNYHGDLYSKLFDEVGKLIRDMPFESELDRQEYLSAVSKSVADWTVSESLKRNIPVEDVLEVANVFMSKEGLRLNGLTEYEKALDKLETEEWMAKGERDFQKLVDETLSERKAEYEGLKGKARASIDSEVDKLYKDVKAYLSSAKKVNSRKQTRVSDIVKAFMSKNGYKGIGDLVPDKNTGNLTLQTTEEFSKQKNWGARKGKVVSYDTIIEHLIERGVLSEGAMQNDLIDVLYNDPVIDEKETFKTEEMAGQMDDLIRLAKIEDADTEQDAKQKIENYLLSEGVSETKIDEIAKENLPNEEAYSVYEYWKKEGSTPLDAYEIAIKEAYAENYGFYEDLLYQESFDVADENARLDDIYPEYEGETININGQEKTVYNSNGERIAKSAEALQNFYNWFGNSKVVDKQGRPLVVYHGTNKKFDTFDKGKVGKKHKNLYYGKGFYFTREYYDAQNYGRRIMPVYLKIENPALSDLDLKPENDGISATRGVWVAFNPNQIKSTSNRGTYSESENIYFQEEDDRDLVAIHSLSAENLSKAIDFGGFPVPSIAIINKKQEFNFDGQPITLVANKEMIDPYDERNEVYNRDIWSKTFPPKTYKTPTASKEKKFKEKIGEYYKKTASENSLGSFLYVAQRGNPASALSEFIRSSGAIMYYLENVKKEHVELPKKDKSSEYLSGMDEQLASEIKDLDASENKEEISEAVKRMIDREFERKKQGFDPNNKLHKKTLEVYKETRLERDFDDNGLIYFGVADRLVNNARKYYQFKGKEVLDHYDVNNFLREKIKDDSSYEDWAIKFFEDELVGHPMVEIGSKLKPFTLDNVVEAMISGATVATEESVFFGYGKIIASGAKKLESISDIREEGKKLVTKEQSLENMKEIEEQISTFTENFMDTDDFSVNMFRKEASGEALAQIVKNKNITKESLRKALNKHLSEKKSYADDVLTFGVNLAQNIKELSRYYFEAKPQRAVGLNEFSAAIIPTSSEFDAIAKKVQENGLEVIRSDNQIDAIKKINNVYFQDVKGKFNKSTRIITLTKKADYSTLPHEFAHYFLQDALDYANSGLASDEYVESLKQTLKDFNGKIKEGVSATKATHEFFARQYERYLYENKADNEAVKQVFDTYEKFLKKCYNNANIPGSAPLSDAQVKFFNEHIRGEIPAPVVTPVSVDELRREEEEAEGFEVENVAREATTEKPEEKVTETKYVYPEAVEDEKGKLSRVYAKTLDILNRESLKYGVLHNEDQALMAAKIVEDLETARKMIDGEIPMPEGLLRTALMIAYEESVKETDFAEYNRVRRKHSLEQTRRGQEIQAEKLGENDITDVGYWLNNAENLRAEKAAKEFKRLLKKEDYKKSPTKALYDYIDEKVAQYAKEIKNGASIQEVTDKIKNDLGVFYQVDVKETYDNVYDTVRFIYDSLMNLTVSEEEAEALNEKILKLKKQLGEVDLTKDINADAWQALKDVQDAYNALNPASNLALMTSTVGRGSMLSAPATYVLNIVSNAETYLVEKAVRRIKFGTRETLVSDRLKKQYDKQAKEAYNISGITLSTAVPEEIKKPSYQGERVLSSAGEGKVRELSRFVEKYVFKYGLGYPDMMFKNAAFIDTVDLLASKYAKKRADLEGRNAVDIANEVFEDATKIQPKTEIGAEIRKQAIQEALIVTFTNNSEISKASLKIRNVINSATGDAMLGDILMPFVKTPANVASLGLQYAFGSAYSVLNIKKIAEDIRKGEMSDISRNAITYAMRNGLGMALALAVSSLLDDDDYIPPYASASMKDRELARLKNAPYNSIKFGNSYVSLDYFGVFAAPLVGALMAKRDDNMASYLKGAGYQAMQIPGLKEISSAYKTMETSAKDSGQALEDIKDATVDAIIARVVPNALTVLENMIDPYFRETRENKMLGRIAPFVLPEKQFLAAQGSVEKTFGDKLRLFLTGSRAKRAIDNDLTEELTRLNNTGNGVTLTEVTRSSAFKNLPMKNRNEIQRMFIQGFGSQKGYSEQVENLIKTGRYKAMSDEDKKKEINKIRTKLINKLKKIFVSDKMAEN